MASRDNRDPQLLGQFLKNLRTLNPGVPASTLAEELPSYFIPDGKANPSCIERYGKPDDVKEVWERIQIQ